MAPAATARAQKRRKEDEPGPLKRVQNLLLSVHDSREFEVVSCILIVISFVNAIFLAEVWHQRACVGGCGGNWRGGDGCVVVGQAQPAEDSRLRTALETLDLVIIIAYVGEQRGGQRGTQCECGRGRAWGSGGKGKAARGREVGR
eukprot:2848985-Rhodomonas_salina.2